METVYINSRAVSCDKLFHQRLMKSYSQHIRTVQSIDTQRLQPIKSNDRIAKNLKKFKDNSKQFRIQKQKKEIKEGNIKLVSKIHSTDKLLKTNNPEYQKLQHTINHWQFRKTRSQSIKQENRKLGLSLIAQKQQIAKSKKKIKKQIEEYLHQRQHIRRFRFQEKANLTHQSPKLKQKSKSKPGFITSNFQKLHEIKFSSPAKPKRK